MTQSIAFINQKGGVGKTTLVANAGAWWGRQGHRVLLIDLDPQAHLTLHFHSGVDEEQRERHNIYRALRGECELRDAVQPLPDESISIIPSHIDLSAAEWELGQEVGREVILRDLLHAFLLDDPYDIILIDCPPSLGLLSLNALAAVDDVVVPVQAEFFALLGMAQLMRVIELVRSRLHPGLDWRVVVPTLVDLRTNLGRDVINELEGHVPGKVTKNWLMKRVKVAEAPSHGMSIFTYADDTTAADEFRRVCDEIATRIGIEVREVVAKPAPEPSEETPEAHAHAADAPAEPDPVEAPTSEQVPSTGAGEEESAQESESAPDRAASIEEDAPAAAIEEDAPELGPEPTGDPEPEETASRETSEADTDETPRAPTSSPETSSSSEAPSSPQAIAEDVTPEPSPTPSAIEERAASVAAPTPSESARPETTPPARDGTPTEVAATESADRERAEPESDSIGESVAGDEEAERIPGSRIPAAAHPPAHRLPPERVLPEESAPEPAPEEDPAERSARP